MNNIFYSSYRSACLNLFELNSADYFYAKEVASSLDNSKFEKAEHLEIAFHVLIQLSESLRSGHSCLPLQAIANTHVGYNVDYHGIVTHQGFMLPNIEVLRTVFSQLVAEEMFVNEGIKTKDERLVILSNDRLYLRRYFVFEQELGHRLNQCGTLSLGERGYVDSCDVKACIDSLFTDSTTEIDWQKLAVANAINKRFSIIAGGPGTGKTYTVTKLLAAIISLAGDSELVVDLVAPTGKAAQRLSESIIAAVSGFEGTINNKTLEKIPTTAQTIHRLLGVIPNQSKFKHNQENLLLTDVIIIDEVSMVDLPLLTRLLRALPLHCRVIMLGDADQLPSVAVGSVLADLAPRPHPGFSSDNALYIEQTTGYKGLVSQSNSRADHLVFLEKSRRFDGTGGIGNLAKLVIAGQAKESWKLLQTSKTLDSSGQLALLDEELEHWLPALIKEYYGPIGNSENLDLAFSSLSKFRILCATRKGLNGVDALNEQVEKILGMANSRYLANRLYHGKPIMITTNDYGLGLYNGDIGLVWQNSEGHLLAYFQQANNEYMEVMPARLPAYETVYAMTIHKTQGSEFSNVVMALPQERKNRLLSRELLYTGITRAKSHVMVAANEQVWNDAVINKVARYSGLTQIFNH